mmetsp:Transcript_49444/g.82305  ORF Transcript_49444/g.82305 Transcript_49444/m.82305 type:complete len:285 (+) Transcript_49444:566-1420(+)
MTAQHWRIHLLLLSLLLLRVKLTGFKSNDIIMSQHIVDVQHFGVVVHVYCTCARHQIRQGQRSNLRLVEFSASKYILHHHILQLDKRLFINRKSVGFAVPRLDILNVNVAIRASRVIYHHTVTACRRIPIGNINIFRGQRRSWIRATHIHAELRPIVNIVNVQLLKQRFLRAVHHNTDTTLWRVQLNVGTAATNARFILSDFRQNREKYIVVGGSIPFKHVLFFFRSDILRIAIIPRLHVFIGGKLNISVDIANILRTIAIFNLIRDTNPIHHVKQNTSRCTRL